ncbi:MAG: Asp23/Gls24 family envelope stress response protein [Anaerovoracaceae bacterium]|nr:Asp23/Gls24 family envelope stress response protein [Anaerovoracaceae bacterium]
MGDISTPLGDINIQKSLIIDAVSAAVEKTEGKARLGNTKMRVGFLVNDPSGSVNISWEDGNLYVRVMIIVKFGVSMKAIAKQVADDIHDGLSKLLGIVPASTTVVVTGTESAGRIVRREIEFEREG